MAKLLVLDGNSLAYRAFFALPETLTTPDGQPTNSVFGFTNMLVRMLREREPDYVAVAFDTGVPKFRLDVAPEYKQQRDETPSPLRSQFPLIREVLDTLKITALAIDEAEADDIIATLVSESAGQSVDVEIVTGDRDMFQCVRDPGVKVIYTRRGISEVDEMDEAAVAARFGVGPDRYVELAAMRGDNSDNLAGVPGIGDKTAAKLLDKYGSLDAIIGHVAELTPKQSENVAAHWGNVERNVDVMTLRSDIDLGVAVSDLTVGEWDIDAIRHLYVSLDFGQVLERTLELAPRYASAEAVGKLEFEQTTGEPEIEATVTGDADELQGAVAGLGPDVGVAFEAAAHADDTPVAIAFANPAGEAVVTSGPLEPGSAIAGVLRGILDGAGDRGANDARGLFATHDAKSLIRGCAPLGIGCDRLGLDAEIAAFVLDPGAGDFSLEAVAERILGIELVSPDAPAQQELTLGDLGGETGPGEGDRLVRRAWASACLAEPLSERLRATEQSDLYDDIERPLIRILARMEATGIKVDVGYLEELSASLSGRIAGLREKIFDLAGREFTINSPKQLGVVLFEDLGLPPKKKTKTGYSTDAATLEALRDEHPIAELLLEYRNLEKLRSTYTDALPPLVDARDGRIHTRFNQTGAATGRLSSENPNLMNIPVRTDEGMRIRRGFVADTGRILCSADYSQIELRVLAHLSQDAGLIEAFEAGEDIHTETASRVFGVPPDELDRVHRDRAKAINYGLLYGMQTWGLASRMGLDRDEAEEIIGRYFTQFPTIRKFIDNTVDEAAARGYTTTLFGRRRWFPELRSNNPRFRQMGERQAMNAPIQGTAADIMKLAMIDVDRALAETDLEARSLLQVHDEIVLELPEAERDAVGTLVTQTMQGATELAVPLIVECAFGKSWADIKG